MNQRYDVFVSYKGTDRPFVERVADRLRGEGVSPWLDTWCLLPGDPWQQCIETALNECASCAVFVGPTGIGPWQNEEMRAAINRRVAAGTDHFRVIPVLLPQCDDKQLPTFLVTTNWVKFRTSDDEIALRQLVAGIRGCGCQSELKPAPARFTLVLTGTIDEMNKPMVEAIVDHLRRLTGDLTLTVHKIMPGSIRITFDGASEGLARLESLLQKGLLKELLGFTVEALEREPGDDDRHPEEAELSSPGAVLEIHPGPRRPRVLIGTEAPRDPVLKELPFVVGLLASLSGERRKTGPVPTEPYRIDSCNFAEIMSRIQPKLNFSVPSRIAPGDSMIVDLSFETLEDFEPHRVVQKVPVLKSKVAERQCLTALLHTLQSTEETRAYVQELINIGQQSGSSDSGVEKPAASHPMPDRLSGKPQVQRFLDEILAGTEFGRGEDQRAAAILFLQELLGPHKSASGRTDAAKDANQLLDDLRGEIARLDAALSTQLDEIIHHRVFQRLEATWRGVEKLVSETPASPSLKIEVIDISKEELARDLSGDVTRSALYRRIHKGETSRTGEPYGAILADYEFDHRPEDIALLEKMAQVAAFSHAPFVAAASPSMFGWRDFHDLAWARDLSAVFRHEDHSAWLHFRERPESRYVGLVLPHILMRLPYTGDPVGEFLYKEGGSESSTLLWGNAIYAFGERLTKTFIDSGWHAKISGFEPPGGPITLPVHISQELQASLGPTDVIIADSVEHALSQHGFMALCQLRNSARVAFFNAQSCNKPGQYYQKEARIGAELSGRLSNVLVVSRFAHYLRAMLRRNLGVCRTRGDCEAQINLWLERYVLARPLQGEAELARYPLRQANASVRDVPGRPGVYEVVVHILPHYLSEGQSLSLRLIFPDYL
jgi:type VI secretion system protein ImpC